MVASFAVSINDLAREHVDEFDTGMAERGIGHSVFFQSNEKRLNDDVTAKRVAAIIPMAIASPCVSA